MNCKRCGYCCTLLAKLSFIDWIRIRLKGYKDFTQKDLSGRKCLKLIDQDCYFLQRTPEGKTNCKIYDIRPKVCREFPYKDATECNVDKRSFKERIINKNY